MRRSSFLTLLGLLTCLAALAAAEPATSSSAAAPAIVATARGPHQLQGVRLRPYADSLRVIFLFDHPAPYTIKEDLGGKRATIEFMNCALSSLPAELSRINDPRLLGIWLKQHDSGLVSLELRFPKSSIRLEHFQLDDPAAVVLDIFRSDAQVAIVTAAPADITMTPAPTPAPRLLVGAHGSVLPMTAADSATSPSGGMRPAVPEVPAVDVVETSGPAVQQTAAVAMPLSHPGTLAKGEADPLEGDYDYFPLSSLRVESPEVREIRDDFLSRRWATVIQKGMHYLEDHKISPEAAGVVYLIAEAKWQASAGRPDEPLTDMMNMYQQAQRLGAGGDLGAFAADRLAEAAMLMKDYDAVLEYSQATQGSSQPAVRRRGALRRIDALEALGKHDDSLAAVKAAAAQTSDTAELVRLSVAEGDARHAKGDDAGAWNAYVKAGTQDPKWLNFYMKSGRKMVEAALATGHLAEALDAARYLNNFLAGEENVSIKLLIAEILGRMGDRKSSQEAYYMILDSLHGTPTGLEYQKKLLQYSPAELLDGQSRYCLQLVQEGKVPQAMAELDRAYRDAMTEGAPTERLEPVFEAVLPVFMEYSAEHDKPFETIGAWKHYQHMARQDALRRRCLAPLATALEKLELNDEALKLVRELREDRPIAGSVSAMGLAVQEARLLLKTGAPEKALPLLEDLQGLVKEDAERNEVYELLDEAYTKTGQSLEAAQALETLAGLPGVPGNRRYEAWLQAGDIFLGNGMPVQTVELGLKGVMQERQDLVKAGGTSVDPANGNALRLMLAKAYGQQGDRARQKIVLDDLLRRPGLTAEQKTMAEIMLSNNQRQAGQVSEAEQLYQTVKGDPAADANWKTSADQLQKMMEWNRQHPERAIDLNGTGAGAGQ